MKVLHIITGLADGGAQAVLHRLCLSDNQNQHVVISMMDEGKYGPLFRRDNIEVYCLDMPRSRVRLRGMLHLWRLVRVQRADVVQTWMYHADLVGGLVSRLAGATVVWGIHHSNLRSGESKSSTIKVARFCAVLSYVIPKRIICCSQRAAELHKSLGYASRKVSVVPNGYDLKHFAPNPAERKRLRAEWNIPDNVPVIGMVARFNPQKDHRTLIAALGSLKRSGREFRCILIGAGMTPGNTELVEWLTEASISEQTLLYEQRTDIPGVMNAIDIHVLSSAHGEAFPNVLCEAMACGTPCVTTDVGDAPLIVGDTGWVAPPGEPECLARSLTTALDALMDDTAWHGRQEAARQRIAEHFSVGKMVESYLAVWAQSLSRRQSRSTA